MESSSIPRASLRSTAISCWQISLTSPASSGAYGARRSEKRHVPSSPAAAETGALADLRPALRKVAAGETLTELEAAEAFDLIMSGAATDTQIGALLMGMHVRGETVDEITGVARAMRARSLKTRAPDGAIDTCGTGG